MNNSKVYILFHNENLDFEEAKDYGDLVFVTSRGNPGFHLEKFEFDSTLKVLNEALENFSDIDYLLPLGDLSLVVTASIIAARNSGGDVRILRWDRMLRQYVVRHFQNWGKSYSEEDIPLPFYKYRGPDAVQEDFNV